MAAATAGPKRRRRTDTPAKERAANGAKGPTRWSRRTEDGPIRWSRVLSAQARIANDYYERDEVKELLVDAVLDELTSN